MSEKKRATAPQQGNSGNDLQSSVYSDEARLSRLQHLVVGLLAMTQSPYIDNNDRALAWSWFDQTLRQYVEARLGI
jgi:hypothetical protein